MIHSKPNLLVSRDSFLQQIVQQLPTLRYSLYVIIPLVLMREIPNYVEHITPVTNEEKLLALGFIITSIATLGYLTLRKLFYNLNLLNCQNYRINGCNCE